MVNPTSGWDRIPVFGFFFKGDDVTPETGNVKFAMTSRVTRVDGRKIYPEGATVTRTIGDTASDAAIRDAVRDAWRDADQAAAVAAGDVFDATAWNAGWNVMLTGAVFASFPASDDPNIVETGYQVTVTEGLDSGTGRVYTIQPQLSDLQPPTGMPPGINLGFIAVPPGSPTAPAPIYAKGMPGGVAALDSDGDVVDAAGDKITGGGTVDLSGYSTTDSVTTGLATKVNSSTYTAGLAAKPDASALTSEAATARAAEGALRNLSDSVFSTALSATIAAASSPTGLNGPDGTTKAHAIPRFLTTLWNPGTKPYQAEPDTTFLPGRWATEDDVLAVGGRMAYAWDTYYSTAAGNKASFVTGPYASVPAVTGNAAGAYMVLPLDGVIDANSFTVETWVKSVGADFTAQAFTSAYVFLAFDGTGTQGEGVFLSRTSATQITAKVVSPSGTVSTALTIASGDIPADTWAALSVTYDGLTLVLRLGNNTKNATTTGSLVSGSLTSADYQLGGLLVNPGVGGGTVGTPAAPANLWQVAVPHVRRGARTPGTQTVAYAPGVLVDASIPAQTWSPYLTGVFSQYYGWSETVADGVTGSTGTAVRDAAIAAAGAAGCPLVRIDHIFDKVTITGTAASPTVTDWSALDGPMDKWVAANPGIAFGITLDFTPPVLGATTATPPTNNGGFASLCSQAVAHWLTKGYKLAYLSLWNEPADTFFWTGTSTQFAALWVAVAQRLQTDYGSNSAVPKLGTGDDANAFGFQSAILTAATSNSLPVGSWHAHDYSGQPRNVRTNVASGKSALSGGGQASGGVWITEWNDNQGILTQIATTPNSLSSNQADRVRRVRHAAMCHAIVTELQAAGATGGAFTRLGILADTYGGIERNLGMFTGDNPPRPLPAFAALSMLWKHKGQVLTTSATSPAVRATATWDSAGKVLTAVVSSYAPAKIGQPAQNVAVQWGNLPAAFTWKMWRFTDADVADGRPRLVSTGTQANLPQGVDLPPVGLYCIQLTSSTALPAYVVETALPWGINYDASNITGLADGAAVASWPDSGLSGQAAVQATGANQPIYKTNVVNGKPVVRFTSTGSQYLLASYASDPIGTGPFTFLAVLFDNNSDGVFSEMRNSGTGNPIKGHMQGANMRTLQRNDAGTLLTTPSTVSVNGAWEVVSIVYDGSTVTLRSNGVQGTKVAASGTISTNRLYLGAAQGPATFVSGDIAKFMAIGQAVDAVTLRNLEKSLGARYGITVA
jgi:hypothetical protein